MTLQSIAHDLECIEAGFRWIERASIPPDKPRKRSPKARHQWQTSYPWKEWKVSSGVGHTILRAFGDDNLAA